MVNNENDKKDNENPEIQEITISGDNLENKPKDENENVKNKVDGDDMIVGENMTLLNKENENDKKPEEENKEDKDKIEGEMIMSGSSNEPNKENEDLDQNKINGEILVKDQSEDNKDKDDENKDINIVVTGKHVLRAKKKDKKPENNEINEKKPGENDADEITGETLAVGSNDNNDDNDKNNDKIKKNRLINQKFKVGDGNNDNNGDNDDIALRTNRVESVSNPQNGPKRRFKIRRAVFVKVKKNQ